MGIKPQKVVNRTVTRVVLKHKKVRQVIPSAMNRTVTRVVLKH